MFISSAFAQTAPAAAGSDLMSLNSPIWMVGIFFGVMYFMVIRPQQKRQKEHKAMMDGLAKGDPIVTIGGVLGTVAKLEEQTITIEVASGVEMQIQRSAVVQVLPKGSLK